MRLEALPLDEQVDGESREVRQRELNAGDDQRHQDRDGEQRLVRLQEADQPAHQAGVERATENLVLVVVLAHDSFTCLSACCSRQIRW